MSDRLSDAHWQQYLQQGYLHLGKVLSDEDLGALQRRIDEIMLGKLRYDGMMMQLDGGGRYEDLPEQSRGFKGATLQYRKIQDLERDPLFLQYMQRPIFREICALHYGAHTAVGCMRAMFMNKPAGKGTVLPWHQDGGESWGLDRDPLVTIWTALDPATVANGCVKVIPGTHRLGLLSRQGHRLSDDDVERHCRPEKIMHVQLKAGEVFLMHNWLVHGSDVNQTEIPRRAFSVCYMDARTREVQSGKSFPVIFGAEAQQASLVSRE